MCETKTGFYSEKLSIFEPISVCFSQHSEYKVFLWGNSRLLPLIFSCWKDKYLPQSYVGSAFPKFFVLMPGLSPCLLNCSTIHFPKAEPNKEHGGMEHLIIKITKTQLSMHPTTLSEPNSSNSRTHSIQWKMKF